MMIGCIGEKLGHSYSVEIHREIGRLCGEYEYVLREVSRDGLHRFMTEKDFRAINVTIPYKKDVIPYLDVISPEAAEIGAVNTVVNRGGKLYGYNTDVFGVEALIKKAGFDMKGATVLIPGSGGTSLTCKYVAEKLGAKKVFRISRGGAEGCISYPEAAKMTDVSYIMNTTPCGMLRNPAENDMAIAPEHFPALKGVFDTVYNPLRTPLLQAAERRGVKAVNGLYMLVCQAVAASELFFDRKYPQDTADKVFGAMIAEKQNVVLTGMAGCGKTTFGRELAAALGAEFIDTDDEVVKTAGKSIPEIFADEGERGFRARESLVIAETSMKTGCVIATGGGSILDPRNVEMLKKYGKMIFIDRDPAEIVPGDGRPLMKNTDDAERLYAERIGIYNSTADVIIKNNGSKADVTASLIAACGGRI